MTDILSFVSLIVTGVVSVLTIMFLPAFAELKRPKDAGPRMLLYDNLEVGHPFLLKPARRVEVGDLLEVKASWNGLFVKKFALQNIESEA